MTTAPASFAQIHALLTGQDGPLAPTAHPDTYSYPETVEEATAERMARVSIAAGLHHQQQAFAYLRGRGVEASGDRWLSEQTAASALSNQAFLLIALRAVDPVRADELARDLWTTADCDGGTEAALNYAARAMGIPLGGSR